MDFLIKGIISGFLIAVPVGPVGILCIRRALADGRWAAFVAGIGAALADTIYGAVAAFGLTFISSFLTEYDITLRLIGGIFVCFLGVRTFRSRYSPSLEGESRNSAGFVKDSISTFIITLTNPGTLLGFMMVFPVIGATTSPSDTPHIVLLVLGVFTGSTLWWLTLSGAAGAFRSKFEPHWLEIFNHIAGAVLVLFGISILVSIFFHN